MKCILFIAVLLLITHSLKSQQLRNADFELWNDSTRLTPGYWSVDLEASLYHNPSKTVQHGKHAIVISTWYSYVRGHLFYGSFPKPLYQSWTDFTVPFTGKPLKLTGYYRYTDPVNSWDSAGGQIIIKDVNGDTLAYGSVLLDTAANWTKFEIPLRYYSTKKPSAIAIHFASREGSGGMNDDSYPNRLYLDNFKLIYRKEK